MFVKLFVFAIIGAVWCSTPKDDYFKGDEQLGSPFYEVPCTSVGGLCLPKDECPDGYHVGVTGLCPRQQNKGVECCYSVSKSATTCREKGGECVPSSWGCKLLTKASDCDNSQDCCILVH